MQVGPHLHKFPSSIKTTNDGQVTGIVSPGGGMDGNTQH
jgi:hypothetical protein